VLCVGGGGGGVITKPIANFIDSRMGKIEKCCFETIPHVAGVCFRGVSDDDGVFLVPLCGGMRLTMTRGCKGGVFKAEYLLHCSYRCIAASE